MPQRSNQSTLKVVNGRAVPSKRFNLKPGAPSHVIHSAQTLNVKPQQLRPNVQVVAHPLLWSLSLDQEAQPKEPLPVQQRGDGPLMADRYDATVRWYLPSYELLPPSNNDPVLVVQDIGVDDEGGIVHAGILSFQFEEVIPPDVERAVQALKESEPDVDIRATPVSLKEAVLRLHYIDEEAKTLSYTAAYDADANKVTFELRANALKLAYALLAQRDGLDLELIGDYNAWVPTAEHPSLNDAQLKAQHIVPDFQSMPHLTALKDQRKRRFRPRRPTAQTKKIKPNAAYIRSRLPGFVDRTAPQKHVKTIRPALLNRLGEAAIRATGSISNHPKPKPSKKEEVFNLVVEDVFTITGRGTIVAGTIAHGTMRLNDEVTILTKEGKSQDTVVTGIRSGTNTVQKAGKGRSVGLLIRGIRSTDVKRGDQIVKYGEKPSGPNEPPRPPSHVKQRQIFRFHTPLSMPCNLFGHAYLLDTGEGKTAFACDPPWSNGFRQGARYRILEGHNINLDDDLLQTITIYESLNEVATFLLVPEKYVITRTNDTCSPTISMTSVLDPEEADSNTVVFDCIVSPDLLDIDIFRVQSALSTYLNETSGMDRMPVVKLPTALPSPPQMDWADPFTSLDTVTTDGDSFALTAKAHSVENAAAVVQRITDPAMGLRGTLTFALDETQTISASVFINMAQTTGPALTHQSKGPNTVVLQNATESEVIVHELLFRSDEGSATQLRTLTPPITLVPEASYETEQPPSFSDRILVNYDVNENTDLSLRELRIDVSLLEILLTIDTDLQPREFVAGTSKKVDRITVTLKHGDAMDSRTITSGDRYFDEEVVSLLVPLDRYLVPERRTVEYKATFHLVSKAGDEDERQTGWESFNYGFGTNLTVRGQQLEELLPTE